jgi:putative membrane-bound dehydrogenase-like protein
MRRCGTSIVLTLASLCGAAPVIAQHRDEPRASDPALQVALFAASPDIVHPVGIAFDHRSRLLVIESHTHFRPKDYKGPTRDRIRVLEDTDGDGKADRFTTYYEGTAATMAIAVHPEGAVYVATRNEILRLRDTKGAGKADEVRRIAFLDTKADYPHNGLSGLCFDSQGNLLFGMGENIGGDYRLIGADGRTLTGGGEGGNIFWCTSTGLDLRRVATGFWNPFGICRDIFGRVFAVDNDPDAMPPCRLLHVVEGGDYGYQYRYGRSGRHPFQAWDGQLPGTLPMASGVGEAPCQVLAYESDGLPPEYRGNLLVASWADHRIERYELKERGASVSAQRLLFVQGGKDFRPVGIAVAPDGSLFVSDWVRSDYTLHGKGAIWQVRARVPARHDRPADPKRGLLSMHRPLRDQAAWRLEDSAQGREFLREQLTNADMRIRAASLTALVDAGTGKLDLKAFTEKETVMPLQALAARSMVRRHEDASQFVAERFPAPVRMEAIASLKPKQSLAQLIKLTADRDPFIRNAAVQQLARDPAALATINPTALSAAERMGVLLSWRASGKAEGVQWIRGFLMDPDVDMRFMAAKWIADENLKEYRPAIVEALKQPDVNVKLFFAYSAALGRLDGVAVNEKEMAGYFFGRLQDERTPLPLRVLSLQMIPANYKKLTPDLLGGLVHGHDASLQLEAVRALVEAPSSRRLTLLAKAVHDRKLPVDARAHAILGLAGHPALLEEIVSLAKDERPALSDEALRALVGSTLTMPQQSIIAAIAQQRPASAPLAQRVLGKPFAEDRPPATDVDAWLKRLEGPADSAAGRRLFFHPKLAGCLRCHRCEGRGADVGPDLSTIGRTERRAILESILQPSNLVAPHYQAWVIESDDGQVRTGMLLRTVLDEYTYLDAQGGQFNVNTRNIVETRAATKSIMPDGLTDQMTVQEVRDLLAYLCERK